MATMYGGIDWARRWLDCALVHRDGTRLGHRRIVYAETADPVGDYLSFLREHNQTRWQAIPTAIEDTNLLFVEGLVDCGMEVIHIDATKASRARKAATVGRDVKSDKGDAFLLAEMLRSGAHAPLRRSSPQARALRVLAQAQGAATANRTRALLALRASLNAYFPAAASAWPPSMGLGHPQARAVLALAPSPGIAATVSRMALAQALREAKRFRTVEDEAERLHLHFRKPALRSDSRVEQARMAEMLSLLADVNHACARVEDLTALVSDSFTRHPSYKVITSFPGIGDVLGARILAEIGDAEERFPTARALRAYAGMAPVTWASGISARVTIRYAVNVYLRQALTKSAFCMLPRSPGAKAYYDIRRQRGASHFTSLRAVGARIVSCLHHCTRHECLYDEPAAWPHYGRNG
ncbi:transposase [Streptomyces tsukubensis]|uniref:IS110 family transposase n=1 Tax=Streptomyces tsukubensis TaxID=83656 RepID=UPI00367AC6E2